MVDPPPNDEAPSEPAFALSWARVTVEALLDALDDGVLGFDKDGVCRLVGRQIEVLFGVTEGSLLGRTRAEATRRIGAAAVNPAAFEAAALDDAASGAAGEFEFLGPSRRVVRVRTHAIRLDGQDAGRLCIFQDCTREWTAETARAGLQRRLQSALATDPQTGLFNQRRFGEELEREHQRSMRTWERYAIIRVDIDRMSELNRSLGEPAGDRLVEQIASLLKRTVREYDVLARFDSDDFAILLPGADQVTVESVCERVALAVRELPPLLGGPPSVCVGGAVWSPPSREPSSAVVGRAVASLAAAQQRGPSHVAVEGSPRSVPPSGPLSIPPT